MLADSSKLGEELDSKEAASSFVSEWALLRIPEGVIHVTNVVIDEYKSFGVSKCASLGIKDGPVLGLKDNIKVFHKLWNTVGVVDFISDFIRVDTYDVNTEGFLIITSEDAKLSKFDSKMLGFLILLNWEDNVLVLKWYHFFYLSDLMKASLKVEYFALIY